jgi:ribonuclease HI
VSAKSRPHGAGIYAPEEVCSVSLYLGNGTNQRAELIALTKAIEMADDGDTIYTDSRYALGMAGKWKAKTNTELVIALRAALKNKNVSLKWVRGHDGNSAQEMADSLAVEAIRRHVSYALALLPDGGTLWGRIEDRPRYENKKGAVGKRPQERHGMSKGTYTTSGHSRSRPALLTFVHVRLCAHT